MSGGPPARPQQPCPAGRQMGNTHRLLDGGAGPNSRSQGQKEGHTTIPGRVQSPFRAGRRSGSKWIPSPVGAPGNEGGRTGRQATASGPPRTLHGSPPTELKAQGRRAAAPFFPTGHTEGGPGRGGGWTRSHDTTQEPPAKTPGRWAQSVCVWGTAPERSTEDFEGQMCTTARAHPSPTGHTPSCPPPPPEGPGPGPPPPRLRGGAR
ncbi:hypothetical protein GWK47_018590 [Chionoecetes opilio]|uniref:Uncharacterized protein n=1 Tax=Chionoecetes opilio TaxID=41210 RepID=A0A8J4XQZ7_CHIOP|nr:hypothetical protein GWK47_018590 [Chionoecetes opilio]